VDYWAYVIVGERGVGDKVDVEFEGEKGWWGDFVDGSLLPLEAFVGGYVVSEDGAVGSDLLS
jgi:hypothetical protein